MAANWKHGLSELCIFFLILEHFPREPQVLWSWQRKSHMTFWLSISWRVHTSWWGDFFFLSFFLGYSGASALKKHITSLLLCRLLGLFVNKTECKGIVFLQKSSYFKEACHWGICSIAMIPDDIICLIVKWGAWTQICNFSVACLEELLPALGFGLNDFNMPVFRYLYSFADLENRPHTKNSHYLL